LGTVPSLTYRKFEARRNGELKGLLVTRCPEAVELSVGVIADVFAEPEDRGTLMSLLTYGTRFFGDSVAAIQCVATAPAVQACLQKLGYRQSGVMIPTLICNDPALRSRCAELKDDWYFTTGDHDIDQVWVA
jgi:hypothetical protein